MQLLCLSNGHGEDAIALRILQHVQQCSTQPKLAVLPLVGEGLAFAHSGIPLAGPVKRMPSGGFVYMDSRQLVRDVRGGLVPLTLAQLKTVNAWAKQGGAILAVGDIVPLLFAHWSGAPYAFVGTAKSEYYLRDEAGMLPPKSWFDHRLERWWGSIYHPWERWLMGHHCCKAVFPRDKLTTDILRKWAIPAFDLGNPMMDGLEPGELEGLPDEGTEARSLTFALMPGSRPPEAYENWERITSAVMGLMTAFRDKPLLFLGAIAPTLDLNMLCQSLHFQGWQPSPPSSPNSPLPFTQRNATLLLTHAFNDCLHRADFAIAMAGTATEQFVGLGKPAILIPGKGPQFTPAFAEAQTRLLGPSAILVKQPNQVATVIQSLLQDPDRLQLIADNGRRRMGTPGAAQRIAQRLVERLGDG